MTPIALLADDYGIAPGTSRGIRELIEHGRLSGTSCLMVSPHFAADAPALRPLADKAAIGLHLAFTDFAPLGSLPGLAPQGRLPGLVALIFRAYLGRLDAREIGQEIDRQLDAFERAFGRPPDYVDGHQHVHQLPTIREALVERFRTRLPGSTVLRVCDERFATIRRRGVQLFRSAVIAAMGAGLRRLADAQGIATNRHFSGVRSFTEREPYRALFQRYVAVAHRGLAIMCHPGHPDSELRALDPVVGTRADELAYLLSGDFRTDLDAAGVRLGRLDEVSARAAPP